MAPVRIEGPVDGAQPAHAQAFEDPESAQALHPRAEGIDRYLEQTLNGRIEDRLARPVPARLFDSRDPIRAIPAILEMPGHLLDSIVRDAPSGEQAPGLEIRACHARHEATSSPRNRTVTKRPAMVE